MMLPEERLAHQGPAGLLLLVDGAMNRGELDKMYRRNAPKQAPQANRIARHQVVGAVVGHALSRFGASDLKPLRTIADALTRRSRTEARLLAAMAPNEVADKLTTYGGMSFRRQRARMIWAALCDERSEVAEAGMAMLHRITEAAQRGDEQVVLPKTERRGERPALPQLGGDDSAQLGKLRRALAKRDEQLTTLRGELETLRDDAARARGAMRRDGGEADDARQRADAMQRELAEAQAERAALQRSLDDALARAEALEAKTARTAAELEALREELEARPTTDEFAALQEAQKAWGRERQRLLDRQDEQPEAEGVVVLFDASNIGAGARAHGGLIDFAGLLKRLLDGRRLRQAIAFAVAEPGVERDRFEAALRSTGIEVRWKRKQRFADGSTKADWDVAIAIEALRWAPRAEAVIVVSGDGDFLPLVTALRAGDCRCEAAAWPERCNGEWRSGVARFHAIDGGDLL